ncbi:MAG: hypothetical protein R3F61_30665 [Myxococcota bacterium]
MTFLTSLVLTGSAYAAKGDVTRTVCVKFQTDYIDEGVGDYWATNADRPGRGMWTQVIRESDGVAVFADYVAETNGCASVNVNQFQTYTIRVTSKAFVNGVEIWGRTTPTSSTFLAWSSTGWSPGVTTQPVEISIPFGQISGNMAVATWMMKRSNFGLDQATTNRISIYANDPTPGRGSCCGFLDNVVVSWPRRYLIAHEIGHHIWYRLAGNVADNFDLDAPVDGCNADEINDFGKHPFQKEYQSTAAREGWAHFVAAWAWNKSTQSDCDYATWNGHGYDIDLDGTVNDNGTPGNINDDFLTDVDNNYPPASLDVENQLDGLISCETDPVSDPDPLGDDLANFITAKDWLEDVWSGSSSCGGSNLNNRGTSYDWTRFWWDMHTDNWTFVTTTVDGVPVETLAEIYVEMGPQNWQINDVGGTNSANVPKNRLQTAASNVACAPAPNCTTPYLQARDNGQDH